MKIYFKFHTQYGVFDSEVLSITENQYANLMELSKTYYTNGEYQMFLPDGFLIASPQVVQNSILEIKILDNQIENQNV